ncbi:MAG TPA: nitroreductase/quinone reductase family protein [Actinomycetota bacterium]|jgi:deazaflavin-dependent oxidoreductase (nitroreductase family)|nr:nitroreductase/quinone reductase family protein [Actinomycetota bacterium]
MATPLESLARESFCYLTTTGRVSGRPHTIEIWFALGGSTLYLLAGGGDRADWVRNLRKRPQVSTRLGALELDGQARVVSEPEEQEFARTLLVDKYQPGYAGDLTAWRDEALPVAVDLDVT